MMNKLIVLILFLSQNTPLFSQNLVLNPSFEEVNETTTRWSGTFASFNKRIKYWSSPTQASPDLLYIHSLDKMYPKRPKVDLSQHAPRTGKLMVGIKTFGCLSNTFHCKEYIQIKLTEPLQAGKEYYYEYWLCPILPSAKVNSFGIAVSKDRKEDLTQIGTIDTPPIHLDDQLIVGDSAEWLRVQGTFVSDDQYNYIIIGNFGEDETIKYVLEEDGLDYGYYLLDDVLLKPLNPDPTPKFTLENTIILEKILFEFDKADFQESSKPALNELVNFLQVNYSYKLKIMGHTDSDGSSAYNQELSQDRANKIKDYLIEAGIDSSRITAIGMGRDYPVNSNSSEENKSLNRRVEIVIIEK